MKFFSSWPIRKKLLFLIFVAVLPALGIILFSGIERRKSEIASTKWDTLNLVKSLAAQKEQLAASTMQMLKMLAQLPEVQKIDAEACNRIFRDIQEQNPVYAVINAVTPDGNMFAASLPFPSGSVNLADRKHIRDAIRTRDFSAGEYIAGRVVKDPTIIYAYPVLDKNRNLIAIVSAGIKLDKYKEFMAQLNLPEGSVTSIADHKNITLYRLPERADIPPGTPLPLKNIQGIPVDSREGFYEGIGRDNVSRIFAYKRLWLHDKEPWYLVIYVGIDKNLALHQANIELVYNLVILGIACLFAMLLAWFAGNSLLVKPLNKLVIATKRLGEGQLHVRTDLPHGEDELGGLAKSFNTMAVMLETKDIERRKAEEALQDSETRFRQLADLTWEGILIHRDGIVLDANRALFGMFGYETVEAIGRNVLDFIAPEYTETAMQMLKQGAETSVLHFEGQGRKKDGTVFPIEIFGRPITHNNLPARVIAIRDLTERKQAEEDKKKLEDQNRQLQKAESLGRMAGAIAHTFNNQLGVVIGNLEMALMDLPQGAKSVHSLTTAMQAANKAAAVSGQMLTYLGQSFDKRELLDLSDACRKSLTMLQAIMPGNVVLETDLPSPGPSSIANAIEIQQVLTNLITNAWEAVGAGRGSIHLSVKTVSPAEIPTVHRHPIDWQPQGNVYACLEVTDTGCGIADKDTEKIFDPFFSSKFTGRGMGLAAVLGIVRAHDGVITVESEPGQGSTFRAFFPVSAEEVPQQPDKDVQPSSIEAGGTVLLVEDEEMVRNMAAAMLNRLGFLVLEAKDGVEAVEVFRQRQDEIRLVLSDLTMPRMDGWETLTALRKLAPDIPVILASGYDKAQVMSGDHPELPQVFLGKPYRLKELSNAIRQALVRRN